MTDPSEDSIADSRSYERPSAREHSSATVGGLLAIGWLCVPALQYLATSERTRYQTGEATEPSAIVELDLTPIYLVLVLLTMAYALRRLFGRRGADTRNLEIASDPGGSA